MKQSKKIIGGLAALCVVLAIVVVVLLVRVLTPQEPAPSGQQTPQASNGDMQSPESQAPGGDMQSPETQVPNGDVQGSGADINGRGQEQEYQDIGEEAAKSAALTHAGLSENQVTRMKAERDWDDGRLEYEIKFWCETTEYEYTIDGAAGDILKCKEEQHSESQAPADRGSGSSGRGQEQEYQDIGEEAAKSAALTHAGLSETQVSRMRVERDWDDGRLEYEVDFKYDGMKYDYTIDGATGAVLSSEKEIDD